MVFRLGRLPETPDLLFTIARIEIVADAVGVVAAFLAIQVVNGISNLQEEGGRLLQSYMPPPPPSVFTP
jgi:hypothetical protein